MVRMFTCQGKRCPLQTQTRAPTYLRGKRVFQERCWTLTLIPPTFQQYSYIERDNLNLDTFIDSIFALIVNTVSLKSLHPISHPAQRTLIFFFYYFRGLFHKSCSKFPHLIDCLWNGSQAASRPLLLAGPEGRLTEMWISHQLLRDLTDSNIMCGGSQDGCVRRCRESKVGSDGKCQCGVMDPLTAQSDIAQGLEDMHRG